jgi:hypothetical protein
MDLACVRELPLKARCANLRIGVLLGLFLQFFCDPIYYSVGLHGDEGDLDDQRAMSSFP